jgi:hypothetical protein
VKFIMPVEMAGRSVTALWAGWLMICFVGFTLNFAPLNSESPGGALSAKPDANSISPLGAWRSFMNRVSYYALSRGNFSGTEQPGGADVEAFDADGKFFDKYHHRRTRYATAEMMRVNP